MFVNMIGNKESKEYKLAQRQIKMRESTRESTLAQYGLPSIFYLLNNPLPKRTGNVHFTTKFIRW